MRTPLGTPYSLLRQLATRYPPTASDCADAEAYARSLRRNRCPRRLTLQSLLIARALWSAWRQTRRAPLRPLGVPSLPSPTR